MKPRRWVIAAAALCALGVSGAAAAAAVDPAAARIETFYAEVGSLKRGAITTARLRPLIEQTFNVPVMAQLAVGQPWAGMSVADKAAVAAALTRYTAARYSRDFAAAKALSFAVDPAVQVRGVDRLVKSEVREPGEAPTKLVYRLREYSGAWQAIDVFENGVSEIATQRADFTSALASGGAATLVRKLDEATAKLR